ncbi:unnamed protein product [Amoebophrya sp. A25]|nr:unnamed protein product [Amoebophrya sp. A25]|eukprot:GSA25T00017536001.1
MEVTETEAQEDVPLLQEHAKEVVFCPIPGLQWVQAFATSRVRHPVEDRWRHEHVAGARGLIICRPEALRLSRSLDANAFAPARGNTKECTSATEDVLLAGDRQQGMEHHARAKNDDPGREHPDEVQQPKRRRLSVEEDIRITQYKEYWTCAKPVGETSSPLERVDILYYENEDDLVDLVTKLHYVPEEDQVEDDEMKAHRCKSLPVADPSSVLHLGRDEVHHDAVPSSDREHTHDHQQIYSKQTLTRQLEQIHWVAVMLEPHIPPTHIMALLLVQLRALLRHLSDTCRISLVMPADLPLPDATQTILQNDGFALIAFPPEHCM